MYASQFVRAGRDEGDVLASSVLESGDEDVELVCEVCTSSSSTLTLGDPGTVGSMLLNEVSVKGSDLSGVAGSDLTGAGGTTSSLNSAYMPLEAAVWLVSCCSSCCDCSSNEKEWGKLEETGKDEKDSTHELARRRPGCWGVAPEELGAPMGPGPSTRPRLMRSESGGVLSANADGSRSEPLADVGHAMAMLWLRFNGVTGCVSMSVCVCGCEGCFVQKSKCLSVCEQ